MRFLAALKHIFRPRRSATAEATSLGRTISPKSKTPTPRSKPFPPFLASSPPRPIPPDVIDRPAARRRDPYFIQIGFDLGTSFSKCICRDVLKERAWVHLFANPPSDELPFLISSALKFSGRHLTRSTDPGGQYSQHSLPHIKLALERIAREDWSAPLLIPFWRTVGNEDRDELRRFVHTCGVYLVGGALGEARREIRRRFPDFGKHQDDYEAVNLAIPVADAETPIVNDAYRSLLTDAWGISTEIAGHPAVELQELEEFITNGRSQPRNHLERCQVYPEVSANVQGFVRSRASKAGLYLFSDTGAGTVDQSVFIFWRTNGTERLTYLHGSVLPLGSSCIEQLAAGRSGEKVTWRELDKWRSKKERGDRCPELDCARNDIERELAYGTLKTLVIAKDKLIRKQQLERAILIFGGGGHSEHPYATGATRPFSSPFFRQSIRPDRVGIPIPKDVNLKTPQQKWMRRLSVAYGLSFDASQLVAFTYPCEVEPPAPEALWRPKRAHINAPGKDEC